MEHDCGLTAVDSGFSENFSVGLRSGEEDGECLKAEERNRACFNSLRDWLWRVKEVKSFLQ